jgi:tetratricopeptide (TPR) repeat protein
MEEDLVAALSLSSGIRIIARSATIGYRGNVSDLRKIGRELGVRYLLEGNVRRVGANLRVTAQLVEAEDGAILWLERFDRPLSELGTLQEQLVLDVTRHLGVQVGQAEMERALAKPGDISAWEAVMRARATMPDGLVIGGNDRAVVEARKAVTIAPDFALGHATLALVLVQNYIAAGRKNPGLAREGREHAERALQLSPNDAQVLATSAIALGHVVGWSETLRYGERALRLNPNNYFALVGLTLASIHFNRPEEAIRHASAAQLVAPRGPMNFAALGMKGLANFQRGHIEEALAAIDEALVMNPRFEQAFKDRAVYLAKLGREAEARQMIDRLRQSHPQLTIAQLESYNINSFFPAELATEMNSILRRLWTAEDALP